MADDVKLIERLLRRFKGVPNFDEDDAIELVEEAKEAHESDASDELILLYAKVQGSWQIAFGAAHYSKFTDAEESFTKSFVAANYRKLSREMQTEHDRGRGNSLSNTFRVITRTALARANR